MGLPNLRDELDLLPGPVTADGAPSWLLHDPVRNRFFTLDWPTFEILQRWSYDDPQAIVAAVERETPMAPEVRDVETVARFLTDSELVQRHDVGPHRIDIADHPADLAFADLADDANRVFETLNLVEREVRSNDGQRIAIRMTDETVLKGINTLPLFAGFGGLAMLLFAVSAMWWREGR